MLKCTVQIGGVQQDCTSAAETIIYQNNYKAVWVVSSYSKVIYQYYSILWGANLGRWKDHGSLPMSEESEETSFNKLKIIENEDLAKISACED